MCLFARGMYVLDLIPGYVIPKEGVSLVSR
jgi:hypothetical protein